MSIGPKMKLPETNSHRNRAVIDRTKKQTCDAIKSVVMHRRMFEIYHNTVVFCFSCRIKIKSNGKVLIEREPRGSRGFTRACIRGLGGKLFYEKVNRLVSASNPWGFRGNHRHSSGGSPKPRRRFLFRRAIFDFDNRCGSKYNRRSNYGPSIVKMQLWVEPKSRAPGQFPASDRRKCLFNLSVCRKV